MNLVRIFDLIGKDIAGLKADIRSRNADGSIRYEHLKNSPPIIVPMKRVYKKRDERGEWMYWEHDGRGHAQPIACGYSGIVMDGARELEYYIEMEAR